MKTVSLSTLSLKDYKELYPDGFPKDFVFSDEKKTVIEINEANRPLLDWLLSYYSLSASARKSVFNFMYPITDSEKVGELIVGSPTDFFNKLAFMNNAVDPILEYKIVDKWYPLKGMVAKHKGFSGNYLVQIHMHAQIGGLSFQKGFYITEHDFKDAGDKPMKINVNDLLASRDLRVASKESVEKAKKLNAEIIAFSDKSSQVFDAWGTGITYHEWFGFDDINVGWQDSPTQVIIEPLLENKNAHREMDTSSEWHLPFVRVFSLKHKSYIYVNIESIKKHEYNREGKNKIVLPNNMMNALDSIFNAKKENVFGDLFHGRHGGIVVLANGPSGVGKTLTAEVFAEYQERPLYPIEMSEIGTSVKEVEANLQRIFGRAKKWNAVLLFDEADIFLAERAASELERSAIVGIFLRLLDYYEGTFFLTTNRGDGIDKAFKSRVTLYLNYPELSDSTRESIWNSMVKAAQITIEVDTPWKDVISKKLNGRQIRNQVRLLKMMHPDGQMKTSDIIDSLIFTAA